MFAEPLSIRQDECCTTVWVSGQAGRQAGRDRRGGSDSTGTGTHTRGLDDDPSGLALALVPVSWRAVQVRNCAKLLFGEEESESVFGHVSAFPIINAGTLMGRAKEVSQALRQL